MIAVVVISLVGILNLSLGLTTLLRTKNESSSIYYFFITIITVLWILPLTLLEVTRSETYLIMLARAAFIGPSFLPLALYGFTSNFPTVSKRYRKSIHTFFFATSLLSLGVSLFSKNFITGGTFINGTFIYTYGFHYTVYFIYLAGSIAYLLYTMYRRYKEAEGLAQLRIKYLLTGFGLSAFGALLTNMILPMLGLDIFSAFGPVSTIFLFYFTTQAILHHRLFDIGTFVSKILEIASLAVFFYLVIFLIRTIEIELLHLSFYDPLNIFIDLVFSFAVAANIKPIQHWLGANIGTLLVVGKINIEEISQELDQLQTKDLTLNAYLTHTVRIITERVPNLRLQFAYDIQSNAEFQIAEFIVGRLYLLQELPETRAAYKIMRQKGYGLLIRLSTEITLVIYEKSGQIAFTKQEIDAVSYLAEKLKVTLAERTLLQKTSNFNVLLQRKVSQQTSKLLQANTKLRELDKSKSDFISMASHQLRTPISVIRGYLSMLLGGDLGKVPSNIIPTLDRLQRNTDQLNNIVEDILNASRIEQSRLVTNITHTDIVPLLHSAIQELSTKASEKGLEIIKVIPAKKLLLPIDQTKIYEAILNLIDNSIAYTQKGRITVSLIYNATSVTISVSDTGIGIPQNEFEHIFKRFSRLDNAKQIRPDGTGIGLFIVKKIVDAHKGKIWFTSKLGEGTTFFIQLLRPIALNRTIKPKTKT